MTPSCFSLIFIFDWKDTLNDKTNVCCADKLLGFLSHDSGMPTIYRHNTHHDSGMPTIYRHNTHSFQASDIFRTILLILNFSPEAHEYIATKLVEHVIISAYFNGWCFFLIQWISIYYIFYVINIDTLISICQYQWQYLLAWSFSKSLLIINLSTFLKGKWNNFLKQQIKFNYLYRFRSRYRCCE